jgi:hypothetical protein
MRSQVHESVAYAPQHAVIERIDGLALGLMSSKCRISISTLTNPLRLSALTGDARVGIVFEMRARQADFQRHLRETCACEIHCCQQSICC